MMSDHSRPSKSLSSRHTKPLKRGRACMNCRFLKIKCDGVKPICGPCELHPRDDECEYADGPGRSRTKVLEDTVSRLEARLLELENPEATTPSVMLHDPYHGFNTQRLSASPPVHIPENTVVFGQLSPFSPTSTTSSLPSGRQWQSFSALAANTESTGSSGSSTSPLRHTVSMPYAGFEEPALHSLQASIDTFIPHAQVFGFFLHIPTFRHSALLAFPLGHPSRPTPGLLNAVHLLGIHFSQPESQAQESALLMNALKHVATDLLGSHPNKVIQTLQAQVLLAYYFFRTASILEAKVHTAAAVSLALGCGLHRIRSSNLTAPSTIAIIHDQPHSLPPPVNGLEEAERINAFWSVLMLHKFVTVSLENPSNVCGALEAPGMQIDTPWPLDLDTYKEGSISPDFQSDSTVRAFLNGFVGEVGQGASILEMAAKAAIIFHRSAHVSGQWKPNLEPRERAAYEAAARSMNMLIELFRKQIPPLPEYNTQEPSQRLLILTHALIDAAAIKLHWLFAYAWSTSRQICLAAARNLITYKINLQELGHFNPIMGNLWMTACHVFIDEISRVRHNKDLYPGAEDELMDSYRHGLEVMSLFVQEGKLMQYQLSKVHDSFAAI